MPEAPAFVASTRAQVEAWVEQGRASILGRRAGGPEALPAPVVAPRLRDALRPGPDEP